MTVRVQLELSDDEDKIVEVYRIQHNKKSSEEAIREIIKLYKPSEHKEKSKTSWLGKL
jgi:hypothetical protein